MRPFLFFCLLFVIPLSAHAQASKTTDDPAAYASFALIVGVNKSVDSDAATLRYADDDAARYLDLFRALGARSYVLARLDENTRRIHPQVAAEAMPPVKAELLRAIDALASDVQQARQRRVKTVFYFVYAGHGNTKDGRGYITLEDERLDSANLESLVLGKVHAEQSHFIVDACNSYFLAFGRGPGGQRHELRGFTELAGLGSTDSVGLLLSTSSQRESHEWAGVQSGVFSHEVRSGLYGAADADGDGQVSYREIAAFIDRANASISNERFRPEVYARPPKNGDVLLDLRGKLSSRIDVPGSMGGHYLLEDSRGVRFADFHNDPMQSVYLLKPLNTGGRLYLRRLRDDLEFVIPMNPQVVKLASLTPQEPRSLPRGAANDAFESLFALPFDRHAVQAFQLRPLAPGRPEGDAAERASWRLPTGLGLFGVATAGAVVGALSFASARDLRNGADNSTSQVETESINDRIRTKNLMAGIGFGVAGTFAATGLAVLFWPSPRSGPSVGVAIGGTSIDVHGSF
jgi:hypothetical protein